MLMSTTADSVKFITTSMKLGSYDGDWWCEARNSNCIFAAADEISTSTLQIFFTSYITIAQQVYILWVHQAF